MNHTKLVFIGGGNMAASLIGGLVGKGWDPEQITVCDPAAEARSKLAEQYGVKVSGDNQSSVSLADVIILAIKPQVVTEVLTGIATGLEHRPLIISIAAGIPVALLNHLMAGQAPELPIVRCMPNTPALLQEGATGLYATESVSSNQRQLAEDILAAVGTTAWVDEEILIDAVTAVSGSGPAYFFLAMEAMIKAGNKLGLAPKVARELTLQTALGAARMALESDVDVAELRRRVTSPGGTTEAALKAFEQQGLLHLFETAMTAAYERSREMGSEASKNQNN